MAEKTEAELKEELRAQIIKEIEEEVASKLDAALTEAFKAMTEIKVIIDRGEEKTKKKIEKREKSWWWRLKKRFGIRF